MMLGSRGGPLRWPSQIGNKAGLLLEATERGLPVPDMIVVRDGEEAQLSLELRGARMAVRSAFMSEDTATASNAGRYLTELGVTGTTAEVSAAVERVRQSGSTGDQRHVIVMRMVAPHTSGVAFSEPGFEDDLVNLTEGLADQLVDGSVAGTDVLLPRVRHRFDSSAREHGLALERLARLLQRLRVTFGDKPWDVEWADDGETCWLIQMRPITVAPIRNETFTLANHKEILPELPSVFMTSRVEASSGQLLGFYTELDPSLPLQRPFVETFAGRPYLNLSMLTDLMRTLGLPSKLVTESYGGEPLLTTPLRPTRLLTRPITLMKLGLSQFTAVRKAQGISAELHATARTTDQMTTFAPIIDVFGSVYESLVQQMGALASSLAPPVALLRLTGTLDEHVATQRTAAATMLDDLDRVRSGEWDFDTWLQEHGHRGIFESDIARPRFVDDPSPIVAAIDAPARKFSAANRSLKANGSLPLWWAARRPMRTRENLRSEAMRGFLSIRRNLLRVATVAVDNGQIHSADDIWLLTIDQVASLDHGARFDTDYLDTVRAARAAQLAIRVPDTLRRFDDPSAETDDDDRTSFRGIPLVRGTVVGIALRCAEPPAELPDGFDAATTVLVARSVDAGWVPIFSQVAAVAVEIGGDLSHGSIILRELQIPSITNVGEIGVGIQTGIAVTLEASTGTLSVS